jgi:hypothetical protein
MRRMRAMRRVRAVRPVLRVHRGWILACSITSGAAWIPALSVGDTEACAVAAAPTVRRSGEGPSPAVLPPAQQPDRSAADQLQSCGRVEVPLPPRGYDSSNLNLTVCCRPATCQHRWVSRVRLLWITHIVRLCGPRNQLCAKQMSRKYPEIMTSLRKCPSQKLSF